MLNRVLSVISCKGGVGKTSAASAIAAAAALGGNKTLLVVLDKQGDARKEFGIPEEATDSGESMLLAARSVTAGECYRPPVVMEGIRENLDFLAGGHELVSFYKELETFNPASEPGPRYHLLECVLAPLAGNYDLVVCDLPPGEELLQRAALMASHFVVCPTRADASSIDIGVGGLVEMAASVVTRENPDLVFLGVILTLVRPGKPGRRSREEHRADVKRITGGSVHIFESEIRNSVVAVDLRKRGVTVFEHEQDFLTYRASKEWVKARKGERNSGRRTDRDSSGLAEDYQRLTDELFDRMGEYL